MNITERLSEFIVETNFQDIPQEVIRIAKDFVLDSIGAQLVGAREPVSEILKNYTEGDRGRPEAGVIGGAIRASVSLAAFLNGTSNHAPELEACGDFAGSNLLSIIPVALAFGEKLKLSGEKVLEGIIVGFEIQGKMGLGTTPGSHSKGWCSISLHGTMGAAVTAAKLLGLDVHKTRMALGLAASQASGLMRQVGTMAHLLEGGIGCRNGVLAAGLAQLGMTASDNILDGVSNFWEVYVGEGHYDPEKMTKDLGNPFYFASPGTMLKQYPCCTFTHHGVSALIELIHQHKIDYEEIKSVEAGVTPFIKNALVGGPDPESGDMGRFSLEHCLASAIVDKTVTFDSFRDEKVRDPRLKEARKKIKVIVHPEWPSGRNNLSIPVTVKLKNGTELTHKVEKVKGTIDRPMSREEQMERYREFAGPFLSSSQIEQSTRLILNLDELKDITELMDMV
ncbi:MAG: MmgE/PrpD family protein, partial [Pseudomonadota bacterium]